MKSLYRWYRVSGGWSPDGKFDGKLNRAFSTELHKGDIGSNRWISSIFPEVIKLNCLFQP